MATPDLEFLLERAERARLLLSQDSHRGDSDLQTFIADMEAVAAVHELFLNDEGTAPRQGLTERQKYQGVVALIQGLYHKLRLPHQLMIMPHELHTAIVQVIAVWRSTSNLSPAQESIMSLGSLALAIHNLMEVPLRLDAHRPTLQLASAVRARFDIPGCATAAAEYVQQLGRPAGLSSLLTAVQLREAAVHAEWTVVNFVLTKLPQLPATERPALAQTQVAAARQLVALRPRCAVYGLKLGISLCQLGQPREGVAAFHAALDACTQERADMSECTLCTYLVSTLMHGIAGPRFSPATVQGLLARGKAAAARCKPWMVTSLYAAMKEELRGLRTELEVAAASRRPDRAGMLPAIPSRQAGQYEQAPPTCAMYGIHSQLKKCSKCRAVAYCSRECQVRHWREGGHKDECSRLAAERRK